MPLRDHFHPPLSNRSSWDLIHGQWPAMMVQQLNSCLPRGYAASPLIHFGSDLLKVDDYEVQIYYVKKNRRLVAAIEIVSPSNKDRPETRQVFVAICEALLRRGVSVAIVDVVTEKNFNLYAELLELRGQCDSPSPPLRGRGPG